MTKENRQYNRGYAAITLIVIFLFISFSISVGVVTPAISQIVRADRLENSRHALFIDEGVSEDLLFRLNSDTPPTSPIAQQIDSFWATTTFTTSGVRTYATSTTSVGGNIRSVQTVITEGGGDANTRALFSGGSDSLTFQSDTVVSGDVYAHDLTLGGGSLTGNVVSFGETGATLSLGGGTLTGEARAFRAESGVITGDLHYQEKSAVTVQGTEFSSSGAPGTESFPVTDAQIDGWKTEASASVITCGSYTVKGSEVVTLGPAKINCHVYVQGNGELIVAGPLWIGGNLTLSGNTTLSLAPSLGADSGVIVLHDEATATWGRYSMTNSTAISGTGSPDTALLLISMSDQESEAINIDFSSDPDVQQELVVYAPNGGITLEDVTLRGAYGAKVTIESGVTVNVNEDIVFPVVTGQNAYGVTDWEEVE